MIDDTLQRAVKTVPPGLWAVGVSGGADSIALLHLLHQRSDLSLHVVHLDHETRGGQSALDAQFVEDYARRLRLRVSVSRRSEVEGGMKKIARNSSARYRAARMQLYRDVVSREKLRGVILAHHADDQAETILQRLLRGAGPAGLAAMSPQTIIIGLLIVRPLLGVPSSSLRAYLERHRIAWREDASNASTNQSRNRIRPWLRSRSDVAAALLELRRACEQWTRWLREHSPRLGEAFRVRELDNLPPPLAREALRRWLADRAGDPAVDLPPAAVERLLEMTRDAASPARQDFPGGVSVRRRGGTIAASKRASEIAGESPVRR